jgi:ribose transport system permease protein
LNVDHHWPIGAAVAVVVGVGLGVGIVNAFFTLVFGIDPFIVTLGTGTVLGGLAQWISHSSTVGGVSPGLVRVVEGDKFLGLPLCFFYAIGLCTALWYFLDFTPSGRRLLIVGRSRTVARLSGISVIGMRLGAFVAAGIISALAGVAYVGTAGGADPVSGSQLLLPAFAAAFLGSTTLRPGLFNPWGAAIAVYFLITGITGLQLLGLQGYVQDLFYGAALVLAVTLSQVMRRKGSGVG